MTVIYSLSRPTNIVKRFSKFIFVTRSKNALRVEYGKLKRQAKEYGIIKKNVDSILEPGAEPRARGKNRQAEL